MTGTGTDVGKTVVTAAVAACAVAAGRSVTVLKPVQTGTAGPAPDDLAEVRRLAGELPVAEGVRLGRALAPEAAAAADGIELPPVTEHIQRIRRLGRQHDLVLVEGAGGVLVRLDPSGGTMAAVARQLPTAGVMVVVRAGLGTLNDTELTVEALRARGANVLGLVIGSWPAEPGDAELSNLTELPRVAGVPLIGLVPAGAGRLDREAFGRAAPCWLAPLLGGVAGLVPSTVGA